jgi:hypothetical protein
MGSCSLRSNGLDTNDSSTLLSHLFQPHLYIAIVNKSHFNFQYVIGRGGFGKVSQFSLKSPFLN